MNKKRITQIVVFALATAVFAPAGARAASPRLITAKGTPFKWDNTQPITYTVVAGNVGGTNKLGSLNEAQAVALVNKAAQQWSSIATAKVPLMPDPNSPTLDEDVNGGNLVSFLTGPDSQGLNPVILDSDGSAIDALLGSGASLNTLAVGRALQSDSISGIIQQGVVILNGRAVDGLFDPDDVTQDDLTRAAVYAFGQFLGVGRSDTNDALIFDGNVANNSAVPIMHPLTQSGQVLGGGFVPTLDDQMSISALYPSATFNTSTGEIKGQLFLPDGSTGAQGYDVIARKVDDPVNSAVSAITGVTFRTASGSGAADPTQRGAFDLHVPAGSYTLEFRPLAQPIGPLTAIMPLPGGVQTYQSAPGAPASSAGPATPTPVTVTAGQATTVNYTAAGTAAPPAQTLAQVKPDDAPANAQTLPASAIVTGTVTPSDPGQLVLNQGLDPASGILIQDKVENLYRIVLAQPSIVVLYLQPKSPVNLNLYLLDQIPGSADAVTGDPTNYLVAGATKNDTSAKALQLGLNPGVYLIGVSAVDSQTKGSDYTLSVNTTPTAVPVPQQAVLDHLVVGSITAKSAQVSWISDVAATADAIVGIPDQQVGDPMPATAHSLPITGLTASSNADLIAISQVPGGTTSLLPRVFFRTADATAATGPTSIQAQVLGTLGDTVGTGDAAQSTVLVALTLHNSGAPASNVQITALTASPGWKLAQPISQPLMIGGIDSNGTAIVVVRLLPTSMDTTPLATVTGTGTLAGAGGATTNFPVNGPQSAGAGQ